MAKELTTRFGSAKKAKAALKSGRGNSLLRRLKPDETIKVRFLQEIGDWHEAYFHWPQGGNFAWCNRMKSCADCKSGDKPRKAVLANAVITASDDEKESGKVVVMQMTPTLAMSLLKLSEKRNDTLLDRDYDLTREGSGLDTVYSADPDDPKKRNLARFELYDIDKMIAGELGETSEDEEEEDEDEPRSTKSKPKSSNLSRRRDDDDYEDDDEEDEEDEEEEEEDPYAELDRSELKSAIKEFEPDFVARKSQSDDELREYLRSLAEDDIEQELRKEESRRARTKRATAISVKKSSAKPRTSGGLNEFKRKTSSNPGPVRVQRRPR